MSEAIIKSMLHDIRAHQRPKHTLLQHYVQTRLEKQVSTYYEELLQSAEALQTFNNLKVLKRIGK